MMNQRDKATMQKAYTQIAVVCHDAECPDCPLFIMDPNVENWSCMVGQMKEERRQMNLKTYKSAGWINNWIKNQ